MLHAVLATASRLDRDKEIANNFNDETETAGNGCGKPVFTRTQTMKLKTVETFFNMLEKLVTKIKISETPGNVFILDKNDIHVNNKPDSIITENVSKNSYFNIRRKECIYIRVTACCNAAGQFLSSILLFKDVNKKQEFGDSLLP